MLPSLAADWPRILGAAALGTLAGFALSLAMARLPRAGRLIIGALCVAALLAPLSQIAGPPELAGAARAAAAAILVLLPACAALPRGLAMSARLSGAAPLQAWRHATLAPLHMPVAAAFAAAILVAAWPQFIR